MTEQRLPTVDGDDGTWGNILNQFLAKEHVNTGVDNAGNGGHKTITIQAGGTGSGTAPLKIASGSILSTPEAGAIEYDGSFLYLTIGSTRKKIAAYDVASGASGDTYYRDAGNNFATLPKSTDNKVLTLASGLPTWADTQVASGVVTLTGSQVLTNKTITFPQVPSPSYTQGNLVYDTSNESLTFYNNDSNISLQVGQEEWVRVKNVSGSTIPNGAAIYFNGTSAGLPTIALAKADAGATTVGMGLTTESIANNAIGYVTSIGVVHGLDTSTFTAGVAVYISATTAGGLTQTAPTAPNYRYRVGIVTVSDATVGAIHITPSTAALGNGTANQLFGINNAGTGQEVKTIAGTTGDITVTNTANTITIDTGTNISKRSFAFFAG
jgi:hypothetical protein